MRVQASHRGTLLPYRAIAGYARGGEVPLIRQASQTTYVPPPRFSTCRSPASSWRLRLNHHRDTQPFTAGTCLRGIGDRADTVESAVASGPEGCSRPGSCGSRWTKAILRDIGMLQICFTRAVATDIRGICSNHRRCRDKALRESCLGRCPRARSHRKDWSVSSAC